MGVRKVARAAWSVGILWLAALPAAGRQSPSPLFIENFDAYASEEEMNRAWGKSKKEVELSGPPSLIRPGLGGSRQAVLLQQGKGFGRDFGRAGDLFTLSLRARLKNPGRSVTVALRSAGNEAGPYVSFGKAAGYLTVHGQEPGRKDLPTPDDGGGRYGVLPFKAGTDHLLQLVADCRRRVYRVFLDGQTDGRDHIFFKGKGASTLSRIDIAGVYGGGEGVVDEIRIDAGDLLNARPNRKGPGR